MVKTRSGAGREFFYSQKYYKIIGNNRGSFQYHIGLNTLAENGEEFDPRPICGPGGLYFTDSKHILEFFTFGDILCEISIPNNANAVLLTTPTVKWKADRIVILSMHQLWRLETFSLLNVPASEALCVAAEYGQYSLVNFYLKRKIEKRALNKAFYYAAENGQSHIIDLLIDKITYSARTYEDAIIIAEEAGFIELASFLREVVPK